MALWAALSLGALAGCQDPAIALRKDLVEAQDQLAKCQEQNTQLQQQVRGQQEQIQTLGSLGDKRLAVVPHVEKIQVGEYSTGINKDDKPGDEGAKVFLETIDQDGTTIKVAGDVTVQLYDLAAPQSENLIAQFTWPADKVHEHWTNGFLSQYFIFECLWKSAPKHDEITVRIQYVDYLTGRTFSAQRAIKVTLATTTQPSTQPTQPSSVPASRPESVPASAASK